MSLRSLWSLRSAPPLLALCGFASIALTHAARAQETIPVTPPSAAASANATETFADFEGGTYDGWTVEGDAFGSAPATDALFPGQITGFRGRGFLCSLHPKKGNGATGKATSREFTIEKPVIRFKIGGGNHPNEACLNLVVDNQIVRTATGDDTPALSDAAWDVSALAGKKAHLEVVDSSTSAERGYILVDDIRFTGRIDFDNLPYQQTVKQMADQWISKYHLPGVWCAYIKDGKVVACVADGVKNIETKTPASVDDHLNVGSVSKVITDTMIAEFVARGVISYSTTVGEVFPELASKYAASPLLKATLSQLITHTAGLPKVDDYIDHSHPQAGGGIAWRYYVAESVIKEPGLVEPGTTYVYANAGPILAVALVEKKLGGNYSYEQWIKGPEGRTIGITSPRSLDWTTTPGPSDVFPHYLGADSSVSLNDKPSKGRVPTTLVYAPQGSVSLTLPDLCDFALTTMNNSAGLPKDIYEATLIPVSSLSIHTTAGWNSFTNGFLTHDGVTGRGEFAYVQVNPARGIGFIFYTNATSRVSEEGRLSRIAIEQQIEGFTATQLMNR